MDKTPNLDRRTLIAGGTLLTAALAMPAAGAAYMGVFVTAGSGVTLQTRAVSGGTTVVTAGPTDAAAPYWVKMVRSGNSLSAFYSSDGQTWTQIGTTITINLGSSAMIGLASTSKSTTLLSTASRRSSNSRR